MKTEEKKDYGQSTLGYGTPQEHKLDIIEFIKADFIDNRLISVVKLENENFILSIENPESSGRAPKQQMLLSKESTIGLVSTLLLYFNKSVGEEGFQKLLEESVARNEINYAMSDNLKKEEDE